MTLYFVIHSPAASVKVEGQRVLDEGNNIVMTCSVVSPSAPQPPVSFTWYYKGRVVMRGSRFRYSG